MKALTVVSFGFFLLAAGTGCAPKEESARIGWTLEEKSELLKGLNQSRDSFYSEIKDLNKMQLNFKPDSLKWSISNILEHLILQDLAYFRELTNNAARPEQEIRMDLRSNDSLFRGYAADPNPTKSGWYAVPQGLCSDFNTCWDYYSEIREKTIEFITTTKKDFRSLYTYRNIPDSLLADPFYRIRKVRDLHQLVINQVAHTHRHLNQIRRLKGHSKFPQ